MDKLKVADNDFEQARRQESKAHNELDLRARQAMEQKSKLNSLLQHKDECVEGLRVAKENGLPAMHIRELKLLMAHVNSSIETIAYKVDVSQDNYEGAKEAWKQKSEDFEKAKEIKKQKEEMEKEKIIEENNKTPKRKGNSRLGPTGYY